MRVKIKEFSDFLINRDQRQGDGTFNAVEFRQKYLANADNEEWWSKKSDVIELDFEGVDTLGPSWANEAFAYFAKFANKSGDILKRIRFVNISPVKLALVKKEIDSGYNG
jgi:hypothetical protein